jgi:hypothetical protein
MVTVLRNVIVSLDPSSFKARAKRAGAKGR